VLGTGYRLPRIEKLKLLSTLLHSLERQPGNLVDDIPGGRVRAEGGLSGRVKAALGGSGGTVAGGWSPEGFRTSEPRDLGRDSRRGPREVIKAGMME
jgi:hypothetical protein